MKFINYNNDSLSKLSLGTVQFGLDYGIANDNGKPSQYSVNEIIDYVYDKGINCFDTAQSYGNSEEVLGSAIKNKNDVFIISKLKSDVFIKEPLGNVLQSIRNLGVESLYGLLLHDSDILYEWKEKYTDTINILIEKNKIKYFGVSIYTNEDFELALRNPNIKFIQIPFNIFDQRAMYENWFVQAKKNNKLIFIRSVFLQGLLLMDIEKIPKKLEDAKEYLRIFESYCLKLNLSKSELALSFVDTMAPDSLLLFGCDNINQAKENLENYENLKVLSQSVLEDIMNDFRDVSEAIYNPTKW